MSWEGALTHFSCKLGLKFFFTALGGADAPTAFPGYAYDVRHNEHSHSPGLVELLQTSILLL